MPNSIEEVATQFNVDVQTMPDRIIVANSVISVSPPCITMPLLKVK